VRRTFVGDSQSTLTLNVTPAARRPGHEDEVLVLAPHAVLGLRGDALHGRPAEPGHEVQVVGGEVLDDADVADPVGKGPDALRGDQEDVAELAVPDAAAQLDERGVAALHVPDGGVDAGLADDVDDGARLLLRGGQRLLHEHAHAGRRELADGGQVLLGRARRRRRVDRAGVEQGLDRREHALRVVDDPWRSPAGSTAPAKATRGEACRSRAWWRPIMPRPSTAPRSAGVGSWSGTALGYPPCLRRPLPGSSWPRRPPSARASRSGRTSSSTRAWSWGTA
jgi:hypothetical protein